MHDHIRKRKILDMTDKLHIYACSGVGDVADKVAKWISEDTEAQKNTQAMNMLLSHINEMAVISQYLERISNEEYIDALNGLDFYGVCFYYARLFRKDTKKLAIVGKYITKYASNGGFISTNTDTDWREQHIDKIIADIDAMMMSGEEIEPEGDILTWWTKEVVDKNTVGLNADKVGAAYGQDFGDLNEYLYNAGTYFLYLYIPKSKYSKLPYIIRKRIAKQQEVYDYCKLCFCPEYGGIYGSEEDMKRIIRTGIIKDFKGETPENVIKDILNGKQSVGEAVIIAAIISAVTTLIVALLGLIINYASSVAVAKYAQPEDPESGMATAEDLESFNPGGNTDWTKIVIFGGIGLLLLYALKNN